MDNSVVIASNAIRTSRVTSQQQGVPARLPWTGYKLTNEKGFFDALHAIIKTHSGPICQTATTYVVPKRRGSVRESSPIREKCRTQAASCPRTAGDAVAAYALLDPNCAYFRSL